jgi:hypothetical protein
MMRVPKQKEDIKEYLQGREGWTMMFLRNQVLKTVRFEEDRRAHEKAGRGEILLDRTSLC